MILSESLDWNKYYLPISVRKLTSLDVGVGEGETARFFLQKGAAKVICIEPSHESFKYLKRNSVSHPIVPINKFFEMSDIEGYEESLLETELSNPAVVEAHGLQLRDKFQKAGWRIEYQRLEDIKG